MATIICETLKSPFGELILGDFQGRLVLCDWTCRSNRVLIYHRLCRKFSASFREGNTSLLRNAVSQIEEYITGDRKVFSVPLVLDGTYFQSEVWHHVRHIPYGQRSTYSKIGRSLNMFDSKEKIKRALAACPISIIIPTHRAICEDKNLNDFAGVGQALNLLRRFESPLKRHYLKYGADALEHNFGS